MIAIFESEASAQKYCDERSKAHGCPRDGAREWDTPLVHADGRAAVIVDPSGDDPENVELVKELPPGWLPEPLTVQEVIALAKLGKR